MAPKPVGKVKLIPAEESDSKRAPSKKAAKGSATGKAKNGDGEQGDLF